MKYVNDWLPWVSLLIMYVAKLVASYYQYAKKADPDMAQKIKHVGELATWAVAYQSKFSNKTGTQKFDDAVKEVKNQTSDDITLATIKGSVQHAYLNSDLSTAEPVKDNQNQVVPEPQQVETTTQTSSELPPAEPIQEVNNDL